MLMVDSHNAYKVMALLFFLAGTQIQRNFKQRSPADSLSRPA
jgi:hypothetical protein